MSKAFTYFDKGTFVVVVGRGSEDYDSYYDICISDGSPTLHFSGKVLEVLDLRPSSDLTMMKKDGVTYVRFNGSSFTKSKIEERCKEYEPQGKVFIHRRWFGMYDLYVEAKVYEFETDRSVAIATSNWRIVSTNS